MPIGSSTSHDDPHIDKKLTASCARCATGCVRARSVWRARALRPPMSRAACPAPPHHIFSARGRRCCRALVEGCSAVLSCMTTSERYIKDPRLTEQTTKSRFCTPWVFERPIYHTAVWYQPCETEMPNMLYSRNPKKAHTGSEGVGKSISNPLFLVRNPTLDSGK